MLRRTSEHAPTRMTDGRVPQFRPWQAGTTHDGADAAIAATRRAGFPAARPRPGARRRDRRRRGTVSTGARRAPRRDARSPGDVATPRGNNLGNVRKMLDRASRVLVRSRPRPVVDVRVGRRHDGRRVRHRPRRRHVTSGADAIDPELSRRRARAPPPTGWRAAARPRRGSCSPPATPPGCSRSTSPSPPPSARPAAPSCTPGAERWVGVQGDQRRVRYVGGVATVGTGGDLLHTHAPEPMQAVLVLVRRAARPRGGRPRLGRGGSARPGPRRSGSPTPTTPRCSWEPTRARSTSPSRSTTTSRRSPTSPLARYLFGRDGAV